MTEGSSKKTIFVRSGLLLDILLSSIFCFSILTFAILLRMYVLVHIGYSHILTLLIPSAIYVFIRRFRLNFLPMFLLHAAVCAAYAYIMYYVVLWGNWTNPVAGTVFLAICAFALLVYSMTQRLLSHTKEVSGDLFMASAGMHVVLYIFSLLMKSPSSSKLIMLHMIMITLLFFIARQISTFNSRYYHNLHSSTQPVHSIKKQNYLTITVIFAGIILALLLLSIFPVKAFGNLLAAILRWIVLFFAKLIPDFEDPSDMDDMGEDPMEELLQKTESSEDSGNSLITVIITTIFVLIIAFMAVYTIIQLIRVLIRFFKKPEETEKVIENDAVFDIIEVVPPKKTHTLFSRHDFGKGKEKEIRRKYFKKVQKAISSGTSVPASSTPRKIEAILKEKGDPSISELTSHYESVRYGKNED